MKIKFIMIAFFGILLFSCAPKVIIPVTPAVAEVKTTALSPELAEGKNLFENNCANCHKLYDRNEFSDEEWLPITLRMQKKAKIKDVEREKIYNYLTMK